MRDENEPSRLKPILDSIKNINALFTFVGYVVAIGIFVVNVLPSSGLARFSDDAVAFLGFGGEIGFAYYEVGRDGKLTEAGQLSLHPPQRLPDYADLALGQTLRAGSGSNLRARPEASGDPIGLLQPGSCFEVTSKPRELTAAELGDARSGGWVGVTSSRCN